MSKTIDEELFRMWGGGIDYALSPDFKDLSDDEKDALYECYKTNLAKSAKQAIKADILEIVPLNRKLVVLPEPILGIDQLWLQGRAQGEFEGYNKALDEIRVKLNEYFK